MLPNVRRGRSGATPKCAERSTASGRHNPDFSRLVARLDEMRAEGVTDLRAHLRANPAVSTELVRLVRVVDVNSYAVELFEATSKDELLGALGAIFLPETTPVFLNEVEALWEGKQRFEGEAPVRTLDKFGAKSRPTFDYCRSRAVAACAVEAATEP